MQRYHVENRLISSGSIELKELDPLGRMAGNFTKVEALFYLPL